MSREEEQGLGIYYDTSWSTKWWARAMRSAGVWAFMKPSIGIYGSPEVHGKENLEDVDGPVVFVANHQSHADTTLLLATIPRKFRTRLAIAAGADYFFPNKFASRLSALFIGAIPIDRLKVSKLSIKNAHKALTDGNNLLIFPSGGRGAEGVRQEHKPGAAFIATKAGAPMVPVYISGTGRVLPKGKVWPSRHKCHVVFGKPVPVTDDADPRQLAARLQSEVEALGADLASKIGEEPPTWPNI